MSRHQFTRGVGFQEGDRIAYAASHLRAIGAFTGAASERRGTFVKYEQPYCGNRITHGRVHWDDEESLIAARCGNFAEEDYCAEIRKNGSLVALSAIAKVGSARFALNDL